MVPNPKEVYVDLVALVPLLADLRALLAHLKALEMWMSPALGLNLAGVVERLPSHEADPTALDLGPAAVALALILADPAGELTPVAAVQRLASLELALSVAFFPLSSNSGVGLMQI